LDSA
jgi:hypothetical protein